MKVKMINKKMIAVTMLVTFIISIFGIGSYVNATDDLMGVNRNVSVSNVKANDTFEVKYTITPKPIAATSHDNNKQKEIIFVMDTSGSMNWVVGEERNPNRDEKSRLDIMKDVAKNFISKFNNNNKARISLVEYNNWATIKDSLTNIKSNNIDYLNSDIESLRANGSTNIGDGLRKAYYMLSDNAQGQDKYIVLMTDGEAEAYSSDYNGHYIMSDAERYYYNSTQWRNYGNGNRYADPDYRQESMEYAKKVASELIANPNNKSNINTFVIGFGSGTNGDKNKQIADSAKGTYFQAQDENTVNEIYDKIQKIIETNVNGTVHFEENISSNLEVVEVKNKGLPQEFKINNNKLVIDVNNYYTLTNQNYTSDPIEFTVKYKVKDNNLCKLGAGGNSSFVKLDVLGKTDTKYLEEKIIGNSVVSNQVTMKVSDSSGTINKEYDSTVNELNYVIDNNGEVYKLYGQANVAINVEGSDATHLKYRFRKEGQNPSEKDWEYIVLNADDDVDTEKEGYLTQMPYDVSHMELLSNTQRWSNRHEVFKTPFADKTGPISTRVSPANEHYVTSEQVKDKDGKTITRWVPKTLFVQNHYVARYAPNYKEASKTWGYIKVPTTGDYWFRTWSDDGFYGTITVNGQVKVLGDEFKPRGSSKIDAAESIRLEAGKYYPIYLEYFNWGGSADYRIQCSLNNENNYKEVGERDIKFYPSKSDSPIDNGNNIFMGNKTVNFKTEPGIYTIEYELLKEKNIGTASEKEYESKGSGSFGKFEIEERFELSKSLSKDKIEKGEEFEIRYTLKPKPIKLTDLYKGSDSTHKPSSILVKNILLKDDLPEGLVTADTAQSTTINKVKNQIQYNLVGDHYEADEYTFGVAVKPRLNVDNVSFNGSGEIGYRDVSLKDDSRISQKQEFIDEFEVNFIENTKITHGLYKGIDEDTQNLNSIIENIENSGKTFAKGSTVTLGAFIDGVRNDNKITLEIPQGVTKIGDIKVFKVNDSGIVEPAIGIMELENGKYTYTISGFSDSETKVLVRYIEVLPTEEGSYKNTIQVGNSDKIPATVTVGDEDLPDLF